MRLRRFLYFIHMMTFLSCIGCTPCLKDGGVHSRPSDGYQVISMLIGNTEFNKDDYVYIGSAETDIYSVTTIIDSIMSQVDISVLWPLVVTNDSLFGANSWGEDWNLRYFQADRNYPTHYLVTFNWKDHKELLGLLTIFPNSKDIVEIYSGELSRFFNLKSNGTNPNPPLIMYNIYGFVKDSMVVSSSFVF